MKDMERILMELWSEAVHETYIIYKNSSHQSFKHW